MRKEEFLTKSAAQTRKLAVDIVKRLAGKKLGKNALVLALAGELGGGKTTFVQGLAKALGVKEKILSPTFVLMKRFAISDKHFANLYHIDCYRLNKPKELVELDFKEIISHPKNLVVIEWADKVKKIIPKNSVWLKFEWASENKRKIYKF